MQGPSAANSGFKRRLLQGIVQGHRTQILFQPFDRRLDDPRQLLLRCPSSLLPDQCETDHFARDIFMMNTWEGPRSDGSNYYSNTTQPHRARTLVFHYLHKAAHTPRLHR